MSETAEHRMVWHGTQVEALTDETRELDLEGALRSSKTTLCLRRELKAAVRSPGIHILLSRWTEDATHGILKPVWRAMCQAAGVSVPGLDWYLWAALRAYQRIGVSPVSAHYTLLVFEVHHLIGIGPEDDVADGISVDLVPAVGHAFGDDGNIPRFDILQDTATNLSAVVGA